MAALVRERVGIKDIGKTVTVPDDARARLMYYLDCICGILPNLNIPARFRNFRLYSHLSPSDLGALLQYASLLSPSMLHNKVIFRKDDLDQGNVFLELTRASTTFAVVDSLVIGGQRTNVSKIMLFKGTWLQRYYYSALSEIRMARGQTTVSCTVL